MELVQSSFKPVRAPHPLPYHRNNSYINRVPETSIKVRPYPTLPGSLSHKGKMAMLAGDIVPFSEHGLDDGPAEALLDSAAGENPVAFPVAIVTQPHVSPLWSPAAGSIFSQHCQQLFNTLPYSFEADQTVHDYFHTLSPQQPLDFLSGRPRPRLCPRGHNHSPWPRQGRVAIEKCERRCDFCGTELRTAAALRKVSVILALRKLSKRPTDCWYSMSLDTKKRTA